jgi:hypothetical protein
VRSSCPSTSSPQKLAVPATADKPGGSTAASLSLRHERSSRAHTDVSAGIATIMAVARCGKSLPSVRAWPSDASRHHMGAGDGIEPA